MADRKEEREKLRQQRLAAESRGHSSERRRLVVGYVVAGVLAAAVVAGLIAVIVGGSGDEETVKGAGDVPEEALLDVSVGGTIEGLEPDGREWTQPPALEQGDLALAAKAAGCVLRQDLKDEGANHIEANADVPDYETNPPTSGDHDPVWVTDGAFLTPLDMTGGEKTNVKNFVHALEHGRVQVQYSPDLPEEDQLLLKGVVAEDADKMMLFPNADMPYELAATAWTALLGCPQFNPAALDAVRDFRAIYRGNGPELVP